MNIADVPQSGIYLVQGAIVQLVAQLLDADTGLPIPLQTATALTISIGYPDRNTRKDFAASLLTDGTDGKLVYITQNNGSTINDLLQAGLYQLRGQATIGGAALPPGLSDFYCTSDVPSGSAPVPVFNASAVIVFDNTGVRWAVEAQTNGTLLPMALPSGPANAITLNKWVMKDSSGVYWTVTIDALGALITTPGGSFSQAITEMLLTDSNGRSWVLTITTAGVLTLS